MKQHSHHIGPDKNLSLADLKSYQLSSKIIHTRFYQFYRLMVSPTILMVSLNSTDVTPAVLMVSATVRNISHRIAKTFQRVNM